MPTRNVNLTEAFDDFVADEIAAGRYRNASEVMRAGLRLLQQRQAEDAEKIAALRRLARVGIDQLDQGHGVEFTTVAQLSAHVQGLGRQRARTTRRRA
jgi:antitoxin ParD1/3/4